MSKISSTQNENNNNGKPKYETKHNTQRLAAAYSGGCAFERGRSGPGSRQETKHPVHHGR
jgi:hypothetical protein